MAMSFRKLLIPVDESRSSLQSLEVAVAIAKATEPQVTVMHAVGATVGATGIEPARARDYAVAPDYGAISVDVGGDKDEEGTEVASHMGQRGEAIVSSAQSIFQDEGIKVRTDIMRQREPPKAVLELAEQGLYDLIIMGNGEDDRWESGTVGQVTMEVARRSPTPVLVVKRKCGLSRLGALVSMEDEALVDLVVHFAGTYDSHLDMLVQEDGEGSEACLTSILSRAAEHGLQSEGGTIGGDPVTAAIDAARAKDLETLIMRRPKAGALGKILHGGEWAYELLATCPCSVLMVP
jgi:nucleotide-binding universal stress UspA family protein